MGEQDNLEEGRVSTTEEKIDTSTMTALNLEEITHLETAVEENTRLKIENASLLAEVGRLLKKLIVEEEMIGDDSKVKYFTGLPSYGILKTVVDFIYPCINDSSRSSLSPFNQFLMVLVRLRMNMDVQHLAYHFGIHSSTVCQIFRKWTVMFECLKPLVKWPERGRLYKTMPLTFKVKFSNCVVILDCLEIFMERPTSLMARAQT